METMRRVKQRAATLGDNTIDQRILRDYAGVPVNPARGSDRTQIAGAGLYLPRARAAMPLLTGRSARSRAACQRGKVMGSAGGHFTSGMMR